MKTLNGLTLMLFFTFASDLARATSTVRVEKQNRDESSVSPDGIVTPQLPPLVFPNDPKMYRIVPPNETALNILQHLEVPAPTPVQTMAQDKMAAKDNTLREKEPLEGASLDNGAKSEVEEIQSVDLTKPSVELEEQFHQQPANLRTQDVFAEDIETHTLELTQGHITAIVAGILALLCIVIYAGFLSWRGYIERRYGKRERLVNEEDYYHPRDSCHIDM